MNNFSNRAASLVILGELFVFGDHRRVCQQFLARVRFFGEALDHLRFPGLLLIALACTLALARGLTADEPSPPDLNLKPLHEAVEKVSRIKKRLEEWTPSLGRGYLPQPLLPKTKEHASSPCEIRGR